MVHLSTQVMLHSNTMSNKKYVQNFQVIQQVALFLAGSRDHEFLLNHKGNASNVSNNHNESKISNYGKILSSSSK